MKTIYNLCWMFLLSLFMVSCAQKLQGEGPVKEEKKALDDFKIIEISGDFKVFLTHGDSASAVLKMNDNLLKNTKIKIHRGKLKIESKDPVERFDAYEVYITAKDLDEISLGDSVQLTMQTPFITDNIYIHAKGSAKFSGEFISKTAMLKARDRSEIRIKGHAKAVSVKAENYAEIDGEGFTAREADFDIQDNVNVSLNVDKQLKGIANGNAVLKYTGDPNKDYKTNDRAEVLRNQPSL